MLRLTATMLCLGAGLCASNKRVMLADDCCTARCILWLPVGGGTGGCCAVCVVVSVTEAIAQIAEDHHDV